MKQHRNRSLIQEHEGYHKSSQFYIYKGTISFIISKFAHELIDHDWITNPHEQVTNEHVDDLLLPRLTIHSTLVNYLVHDSRPQQHRGLLLLLLLCTS